MRHMFVVVVENVLDITNAYVILVILVHTVMVPLVLVFHPLIIFQRYVLVMEDVKIQTSANVVLKLVITDQTVKSRHHYVLDIQQHHIPHALVVVNALPPTHVTVQPVMLVIIANTLFVSVSLPMIQKFALEKVIAILLTLVPVTLPFLEQNVTYQIVLVLLETIQMCVMDMVIVTTTTSVIVLLVTEEVIVGCSSVVVD